MSLYHGSSKQAVRVLLHRVLRLPAGSGGHARGSEEYAYPPWEPLLIQQQGSGQINASMYPLDFDSTHV
jgi:hypothetical protein